MNAKLIIGTALSAAIASFLACVVAAAIAIDGAGQDTALVTRAVLVTMALLGVASFWGARSDQTHRIDLTRDLAVGLVGGWALNPLSWNGRSFIGQGLVDTGVVSAAVDVVAWALVSLGVAALVADRATVARAQRAPVARRDERGQGSLELTAVVTIAAVLIGALTVAFSQQAPAITGTVKEKICFITTLGQGSCERDDNGRAPEDYVPPEECVVGTEGEEDEAKVSLVVTLSNGETWLIENLGDGTSRLTRTTSGGVGIGAGVGFDVTVQVDGSRYGVALTASAEAMLNAVEGDVYYADSPEEAEAILNGTRTDDDKDFWLGEQGTPIREGWDWAIGKGEHEDAEPDEWFDEAGIDLSGYAGATGLYETAGVQATEEAYLGTRHRRDGTSVDYFRANASATAGVDAWTGDGTYVAAAQGGMEALVEIERDEDGNPIAMRLTSTTMGDAQAGDKGDVDDPEYTERTVEIPLTSQADRNLASRVLWASGLGFMPGITDGVTQPGETAAPWEVMEIGEELGRAAAQRGYIYQQTHTRDVSENGFTFDAKAIAELGLSGTSNDISSALTGYQYWNGEAMVDRAGCAS